MKIVIALRRSLAGVICTDGRANAIKGPPERNPANKTDQHPHCNKQRSILTSSRRTLYNTFRATRFPWCSPSKTQPNPHIPMRIELIFASTPVMKMDLGSTGVLAINLHIRHLAFRFAPRTTASDRRLFSINWKERVSASIQCAARCSYVECVIKQQLNVGGGAELRGDLDSVF